MPPNQPYPGGQQPYQPPQPRQPQQTPGGQYEVLPPLPAGQNNGHSGHNPYEFIVNPQATRQRPKLFGGNQLLARVAVIVGGAVVLMVVAAIAISVLAPKSPTADMTAIAQRQQEIIRLSDAAGNQVSSQDAKNFMANVEATVTSDQQQTIAYLAAHGTKLKDKVLAMDQNADTDAQLANAATAGNYDSVSVQVLSSQIGLYQGLLQSGFKNTTSKSLKQQLQQDFKSTGMLLEQAKRLGGVSDQ